MIVSSSLPQDEHVLLGLPKLEHLNLLPEGWPENRTFEEEEWEKLSPREEKEEQEGPYNAQSRGVTD